MYYWIFFAITLIVLVWITYHKYIVEQFTAVTSGRVMEQLPWLNLLEVKDTSPITIVNAPDMRKQPMTVYFTKEVDKCDAPGAYYIGGIVNELYRIDFSFDVTYYKKLQEELQKWFSGKNRSPSPTENDILLELQNIIDQYSKFIDDNKTYCKYTIPKWQHFIPKTEMVLLGDIPQNTSRGLPGHWAYVGKDVSQEAERYSGIVPVRNSADPPQNMFIRVNGEDATYTLNTIQDFKKETVKEIVCATVNEQNFTLQNGLQIDGKTMKVNFVKENNVLPLSKLTDFDIVRFFKSLFRTQSVQDQGNMESVIIRPEILTRQVIRLRKTLCGTTSKELTPITATLAFTDVATLKEIQKSVDNKYYQGTSSTMANADAELNKNIEQQKKRIEEALNAFNIAQQNLDSIRITINNLQSQLTQMENIMNNYNRTRMDRRQMRRMGFWGRVRFMASVRKLRKAIDRKKGEINVQNMRYAAAVSTLQTRRNEYTAANDTLAYYIQVKNNINDFLVYMDKRIIQSIRQLLAQDNVSVTISSSTQIVPEHLRYLSYDGNLYINLE